MRNAPMRKEQFHAKLVRVHICQKDQWNGKPLHEAIVSVCMEMGLAGATVYKGIEGFGSSARIHHESMWPGTNDPPIMISIIDREEPIARLLPRLEEMVCEGVIAVSDVEAIRYMNVATTST
jgi:PII-like signaling protein